MLTTGVKPEGFVQLNNNIKSLKKKVIKVCFYIVEIMLSLSS